MQDSAKRGVFVSALVALIAAFGNSAWAQTNVENFETGDLTGPQSRWSWHTGANALWSCTMSAPHGGLYCAKAGGITHNQSSYLETRYYVNTSATISFWYKTDTEAGKDLLKFYIDGSLKLTDSGSKGWTQFTSAQAVTTGPHTFRWEFTRDASGDYGSNMVWLDDIVFPLADGITVISPSQSGEVWFDSESHAIRWISMGAMGSSVTLQYTTE